MFGRSRRHPLLESAVFAAALLLAAFIGRELWQRHRASQPGAGRPGALDPAQTPAAEAFTAHRTETAVTGIAPIKLTRVQRRRPGPTVVPAPK